MNADPPEMSFVTAMASQIRREAEVLRAWGAESFARAAEHAAELLETAWSKWLDQDLTPEEAAAETDLRPDTVRKKIAKGEWPNSGRPYRPRIKRRDLSKSVFRDPASDLSGEVADLVEDILTSCDDATCDQYR